MTLDEAIPVILDTLGRFLNRKVEAAELEGRFEALGADSMDMVALAFELEKLSGRALKPEMFLQYDTIKEALRAHFK